MAIRTDFTAGEVLAAADLNDTFASKPPFSYGTATPTTTVEGFIFYDENVTPPAPKFWDGSAFQSFGGGKILQIVRATDTTDRTTTSTSFVDVTGMSVTITPQKSDSAILIVSTFDADVLHSSSNSATGFSQITDSANTAISGAQSVAQIITVTGGTAVLSQIPSTLIAYATPATLSAVTYKLRFRIASGTTRMAIYNSQVTGQMYAIEVSA